jgi:hypothetical protein
MNPGDRLRESMEQVRRSVEAAGDQVRRAAKQAAKEGTRASATTTHRGGRRNVAVAANVGRGRRVRGVSVTQRSHIRPDGSEEIETTREVYGDDDGKD